MAKPPGKGKTGQSFDVVCQVTNYDKAELMLRTERQRHDSEILFYHSLQVANALFPKNFQKVLGIRFSEDGKTSCIYSEFVPDDTGTIARKEANLRDFYRIDDDHARMVLILKNDAAENKLCPAIRETHERILDAGITVPHPEMNYHFDGKNVIFFEVIQVQLDRLANAILSLPDGSQKKKGVCKFRAVGGQDIANRGRDCFEMPP